MSCCHACGEEQDLTVGLHGRRCPHCRAELSSDFNFCYCCGEDVHPSGWLPPVKRAPGFALKWECDDDECEGHVADHMNFCPSCSANQHWDGIWSDESCDTCGTSVSEEWCYCVACGDIIDWWGVGGPDNANSWAQLKKTLGTALSSGTFIENIRLSKQHLGYTCGAECAWMVLDYFNPGEVDLRQLLFELGPDDADGTDEDKLARAFRSAGLSLRTIRTMGALERSITAGAPVFTIQDRGNHYVVAFGFDDDDIWLLDPSNSGQLTVPREEFEKQWKFKGNAFGWSISE
jgi:predicted double-glycine peptidase